MTDAVRVVVVDDHPMFVDGVRVMLDAEPGVVIVGEGGDGQEAVDLTAELAPDVLVIDLDLPRVSGTQAIGQIGAMGSPTKIVILSAFFDGKAVAEAFELGAIAFVSKTQASDRLVSTVIKAARGEGSVPETYLGPLLRGMRDLHAQREAATSVEERLSPRERQVLRYLAEGNSVAEAADILNISVLTLRGHVRNILSKLDVHSMTQAVALAHRSGLVDRWNDTLTPS